MKKEALVKELDAIANAVPTFYALLLYYKNDMTREAGNALNDSHHAILARALLLAEHAIEQIPGGAG